MNNEDALKTYSKMVDEFAWYKKGDIFQIGKLARELGRNYTEDIAERKLLKNEVSKSTAKQDSPR